MAHALMGRKGFVRAGRPGTGYRPHGVRESYRAGGRCSQSLGATLVGPRYPPASAPPLTKGASDAPFMAHATPAAACAQEGKSLGNRGGERIGACGAGEAALRLCTGKAH